MDRFESLRVFLAVADAGSFVGASRSLGLSAPAVTRAVARLETHLGQRLLHRTTRAVRLTDAGARYRADAASILEQLEAADAAVGGSFAAPQGILRLTAPVYFGERYVMPVVAGFLAAHPAVQVQALLLDRVTNLLEEHLDVAVRLGPLADSRQFSKTVGAIRKVTCAAPAYLDEHGRPATPEALRDHAIVQATAVESTLTWTFGEQRVTVAPRLTCNQNAAAVRAAQAGAGITRLMSYQVADALADGSLELVLEAQAPPPAPVNLVYLEGRRATAAVRTFIDYAAQHLSADRTLNPR
ncbi:MAG: LysR family transcriptional regulator [Pseudomonadota bacterium]